MIDNDSKKLPKSCKEYFCIYCHYKTYKKSSWTKHLSTEKHYKLTNDSIKLQKVAKYECTCGKIYKYDSGYYRHKKVCINKESEIIVSTKNENYIDNDIITMLVKQNTELIELLKNGTHNINSNNNNHNKTFNLHFFLNETCKDALNITDFMNNIQLQIKDLDNTAKEGYVNGISNIIIKELKDLDVCKRPIHCSDLKRETLYVKDNNIWEKDNEEKDKMKKVIKEISDKNIKNIPLWLKEHPNFSKYNHPDNDEYMDLLTCCMSGSTKEEQEENLNKIIKKLSKEVVIEK